MSAFTLSNLAAQTRAVHSQSRINPSLFRRRWISNALRRQAIMMPAISPFMTEGTITNWLIKEGESFVPGDVLLQIENDVAVVDVEACSPGILGKILTPNGATHVPVEAVIAIVARDASELASIQSQSLVPTPPPFTATPSPPSATLSPRHPEFKMPLMSPRTSALPPRNLSLFEMHTMGYGQRRAHVGGPHGAPQSPSLRLELPPPSPRIAQEASSNITPVSSKPPLSTDYSFPKGASTSDSDQLDGAAIRRMIVSNLSTSRSAAEVEEFI